MSMGPGLGFAALDLQQGLCVSCGVEVVTTYWEVLLFPPDSAGWESKVKAPAGL